MTTFWLKFTLKSDAAFGRGDGVAGMVDSEVQHDAYGLPYLGGRALKGLLSEECANILFALECQGKAHRWKEVAKRLFGNPGSQDADQSLMHIGDARLPDDLRQAVRRGIERGELSREQVLRSLTAIRRQTAVDAQTGAPRKETLRATRVILRQTPFEATLTFLTDPTPDDLALLAACIKALRQAGTGRNRGKGELEARLYDAQGQDVTEEHFARFRQAMEQEAAR
jgi:CRISPR/Cas system CSM-associated protein Csm3 (group 7 of RAMP superfamily)